VPIGFFLEMQKLFFYNQQKDKVNPVLGKAAETNLHKIRRTKYKDIL